MWAAVLTSHQTVRITFESDESFSYGAAVSLERHSAPLLEPPDVGLLEGPCRLDCWSTGRCIVAGTLCILGMAPVFTGVRVSSHKSMQEMQ